MSGTTTSREGRWYWEKFDPADLYAGADLATLRKGVGREVGDVWQMARHYRSATADGRVTHGLAAEHATLALFATHQQSQTERMHRPGVELGTAARMLYAPRKSAGLRHDGAAQDGADRGRYSEEAVDRRMHQIATATDAAELVEHLRGLVTLLRTIGQPLDYTLLHRDIKRWHYADARPRIRTRWGSRYFDWGSTNQPAAS